MADTIQICRITGREFVVSNEEQEFLSKMGFPLPTLCIEQRHRRRLIQRNERRIYKDICDLTGKSIISIYSPNKPFKVYSQEAWWSDDWDPKTYGRDFDFNRTFFEQFHELQLQVPRFSLLNDKAVNSEYCNITTQNKNCYLVFGGDINEDCLCSVFCFNCKDSGDLYWVTQSELCYDSIDCGDCYNAKYCQNSYNCRDSAFLFNCRGCKNCFGCVNIANQEYQIFNKQYSKEEYEKKIKEFRLDTWSGVMHMKEEFTQFKLQFPQRFAKITHSENSTGDNIMNGKNCINCFDIQGPAQDVKDTLISGINIKDVMSCDHVWLNFELGYELMGSIYSYNCAFGTFIWNSSDILYSDMCVNSCKHLFGCTNMKKAAYCILNKQYSEKEYFELKDKIIAHMKKTGEWGEFFPMQLAPWAYNETVAQDYMPMTKEAILAEGIQWHDEEKKEIGSGPVIPDSIDDVDESILENTLICERTGRPYKIIKEELQFYKKLGIPIPHFAPETRNDIRFSLRNPRATWHRSCSKCDQNIETSFAPNRPEIVYCQKCYAEVVY